MGCVRIMQTYGVSGIKLKSASSCLPHTLTPPSSLPCSHLFPPSSVFTSPTRSLFPHPLPPLISPIHSISPPPPPHSSLLPRSFTHSFPTTLPSSLISLTHLLLSHAPPSSLLISLTHSFTLSYPSPTISRSLLPPPPPPIPSLTLRASLSGTFLQRKDVVNQCLEFVLHSLPIPLFISLTHPPVPYIVHSFIFSQPPSLSRSLTPPPLYLSLSPSLSLACQPTGVW